LRFDKIDITKSKQNDRLIRKEWLVEIILDFTLYLIFIGFLPLIAGSYFLEQLENGNHIFIASILFGISLLIGGLLIYSIINLNRLRRISGTLKEKNRQSIKRLADKLDWTLQTHNQRITVLTLPWNWLSTDWGRKITVIYDRQDILINITSYGMHNIKSPFHWFENRKLVKKLIDNFEKEIKNDTPTIYKNNA